MKILLVMGTRPDAIKMAPIVHRLVATDHQTVVCATGQHCEMLKQVLSLFEIKPDVSLDVMTPAQTLAELTGNVMVKADRVLDTIKPDVVLVQGDTTTAMVLGLVSFYHKIPVGHVEAGLRTGDISSPFPEELNRRILGMISSIHFAPTKRAAACLIREGVDTLRIHITGNTVIDALMWMRNRVRHSQKVHRKGLKLILLTVHRRENLSRLGHIFDAVREIVQRRNDIGFIFPVHPNPGVKAAAYKLENIERIELVEPMNYADLVQVLDACYLVLTDSGGLQEEAPSFGKPVLVLRDVTERPEAVEAGAAKLIGTRTETIVSSVLELLEDEERYVQMSKVTNPFGDGNAALRIVELLTVFLGKKESHKPT